MPAVCALIGLPLGGVLAGTEDMKFLDAFRLALSIMVQSPGVAPAFELKAGASKLVVFIIACYGVTTSVGWGSGVIIASTGLDQAQKLMIRALRLAEDTAKLCDEENGEVIGRQ